LNNLILEETLLSIKLFMMLKLKKSENLKTQSQKMKAKKMKRRKKR
jgi:hypothetical protein